MGARETVRSQHVFPCIISHDPPYVIVIPLLPIGLGEFPSRYPAQSILVGGLILLLPFPCELPICSMRIQRAFLCISRTLFDAFLCVPRTWVPYIMFSGKKKCSPPGKLSALWLLSQSISPYLSSPPLEQSVEITISILIQTKPLWQKHMHPSSNSVLLELSY